MNFFTTSKFRFDSALFLLIIMLFTLESRAQNKNNIDSLIAIIQTSTDDSLIAQKYIELGKAYVQTDMNKAFEIFDKAVQIGKKNELLNIVGDAYSNIGFAYILKGDKEKALFYLDSAMIFIKSTGNKVVEASIYQNYGNYYHTLGNETESMKYHLLSLKIREELGDTLGQAKLFNGIAGIYLSQKNNEKALEWYKKSLNIVRSGKDKSVVSIVLGNIANVNLKLGKFDEA